MEQEIIEKNKQEFLALARSQIKREGLEELLAWLESSDFFEAPASTKFHSAEAGGLCFHSLNVHKRLMQLIGEEFADKISPESATIVALFHDVCKCYTYKIDYRNVKENDVWVKKPFYAYDDALPFGHGEKSVYIINGFMRLTREEALAINWHMGGFDKRVIGGAMEFSKAYYKYPICVLLHTADILATYLDESAEQK